MKEISADNWATRAFSIAEVVLVLAIMAILAGIALPRFGNAMVRQRADGLARRIAADLERARSHAMRSGLSQTCRFTLADNRYTLVGIPDPDHPASEYSVLVTASPNDGSLASFDLGGDGEIVFDMYGMPDSAGSVIIRVGDEYRTVTIDPESGETSVNVTENPPPETKQSESML
jgi:type II secretory pathway pseudopilin PulG